MSRLYALREKREELADELTRLANKSTLTEGEEEHYARAQRQYEKIGADIDTLEARVRETERIQGALRDGTARMIDGMPGLPPERERLTAQSEALAAIERQRHLSPAQLDRCEEIVRTGDEHMARYIEVHGRSEYQSAFQKLVEAGDPGVAALHMSDLEREAMRDSYELRSQSLTNGSGGYAVPTFIDPTVILTNQETENPFLSICNVIDINTSVWKGVSSAGVSWSFDAEGAEVSDDSLTSMTQPSIQVEKAQGFIPYTIEIGQDWPGFSEELTRLLAEGYDELLVGKFTTGAGHGSTEPMGALTALDASTGVEVVTTTDGQFGVEDIYKVYEALPQKYRRKASWMMSVSVNDKIRRMGVYDNSHAFTVNLPALAASQILGAPVYENPYMPDYSSTTGAANILILAAFNNYAVVRRAGMTVEVVPHLLHTDNNRPMGTRGLYAWARIGGGWANLAGGRLLQNQ